VDLDTHNDDARTPTRVRTLRLVRRAFVSGHSAARMIRIHGFDAVVDIRKASIREPLTCGFASG
jgi:hypothetical protein